jgi:Asp-tRNA(Asn)/Glu-tRNA(Gln) amidotransferase A subunit family amidase
LAPPEDGGPGAARLPVGFQIAAPAFGEQKLLEAAHALEGALGFEAAAGDAIPWKGGARA